jgi:hypothetical protein
VAGRIVPLCGRDPFGRIGGFIPCACLFSFAAIWSSRLAVDFLNCQNKIPP